MREKLKWGPSIPYMITGLLNQHPRDAMKFMEETDAKDIVQFFDSILEEE
jgi:4-hydroxy 2-oxovalerate aldolase